ncbi:MAG: hypothetical protein L0H73_14500, partial [Nitrococcus sp.]|nr:hypothetical protein [Nitrococcus sp.]
GAWRGPGRSGRPTMIVCAVASPCPVYGISRREDGNTLVGGKIEQIGIARDDEAGSCGEHAGEDRVIVCVACDGLHIDGLEQLDHFACSCAFRTRLSAQAALTSAATSTSLMGSTPAASSAGAIARS